MNPVGASGAALALFGATEGSFTSLWALGCCPVINYVENGPSTLTIAQVNFTSCHPTVSRSVLQPILFIFCHPLRSNGCQQQLATRSMLD
jgi:hypothetical protein